jgi:NAD(P)H-nitrite reductase large subunit
MKHVIIGAGAAGISAAKTIRQLQSNDEIVLISTDDAVHSRCMLHKLISGERNVSELSFVPDGFFTDNNIRWLSGVTVTGIDTEKKQVLFNGASESYDKLLIATGAQSVIPPIDGLRDAKNVYGLRDLPDAKVIREKANQANNIVIIGAGLVGLDAAYGLLEMGKKSVVVEMSKTILPLNLDSYAASKYQAEFEKAGCVFHLDTKLSSVASDSSGNVTSVTLNDKEQIPCDLLIVAVGVRPARELLKNSGITTDQNIIVNDYLATNIADVYAAGDVAGLSKNWPNAMDQGEIAAYNMCGIPALYKDTFDLKNTVNFFGITSLSLGQPIASANDVEYYCDAHNKYEKIILRDGVPVGVILQGNLSHSGFWQYLIKNKINIATIPKPPWKISFADYYGIEKNGEYKWIV